MDAAELTRGFKSLADTCEKTIDEPLEWDTAVQPVSDDGSVLVLLRIHGKLKPGMEFHDFYGLREIPKT
jgi:hypothetical protein